MNSEELNIALYRKMEAEQKTYRDWLLSQPPEEILKYTYEYTMREDILMSLEENDLSGKQAQALLKSPCPLGNVFKEYEKRDCSYMGEIRDSMESRANRVIHEDCIKEKNRAPHTNGKHNSAPTFFGGCIFYWRKIEYETQIMAPCSRCSNGGHHVLLNAADVCFCSRSTRSGKHHGD